MRILVLNTDYPDFVHWLYREYPGMAAQSYREQLKIRAESLYGVADFYSSNLRALGHEAHDIYANNEVLQSTWSREHGTDIDETGWVEQTIRPLLRRMRKVVARMPVRYVNPYIGSSAHWNALNCGIRYDVLRAQIEHYKPDVVLNQAVDSISGRFMKEMKPYIRFLVGQHAAVPLPHDEDLSGYDLMVSSFPASVEAFKRDGFRAHLCRLAFEPRVLSSLDRREKTWDISFIGSFSSVHSSRTALLDTLCRHFPQLKIWSPTIDQVPRTSLIRSRYAGQAWGRQMYDILRASRLTLNHHGDVAPYANNMRLYEATGVGTCLLTDWKANLNDIFEPGKEVVAYRDPEECVELARRYLKDDEAREAIGRAGQSRTLREHTYSHRMQEFIGILETYI